MRYLEDFSEGQVFELGEETIREREIIDFARRFDAQPFHVDPEAARSSIYGGLIASGWHTGSLFMGMLVRGLIHDVVSLGSGGLDELRWLKPVRPGDTLHSELEVIDKKPSASKPDRGMLRVKYRIRNQRDEDVITFTSMHLTRRRPI